MFFSEQQLLHIHRTFGHPGVRTTEPFFKTAHKVNFDKQTKNMINKFGATCQICNQKDGPTRRFKLTICREDLHLNHTVKFDTMFLEVNPFLKMVSEATNVCTAKFLSLQTSDHICRIKATFWPNLYCGPHDYHPICQGTNYKSQEFRKNAETVGIRFIKEPI